MNDDIYDAKVTNFNFSYFTKKTKGQVGGEFVGDGLGGGYDSNDPFRYHPGYAPIDGGGSRAMYHTYDISVPVEEDFSLPASAGGTGDPLSDSGFFRNNESVVLTCNNAMVTDFGVLTDIPLFAGWTRASDPEESFLARSEMMFAPSYDLTGIGSDKSKYAGKTIDVAPYKAFRKVNSLVISGLPGFNDRGFLSADSDFTYTCFRSVNGLGDLYQRSIGGADSVKIANAIGAVSNRDLFGDNAPGLEMGVGRDKSYLNVATMPDSMSGRNFMVGFYHDLPDEEKMKRGYARSLTNTLTARVDFEYQVATNGIDFTPGEIKHPTATVASVEGYGNWRDTFDAKYESLSALGAPTLNYKIAHASCGRLQPKNGVYLGKTANSDPADVELLHKGENAALNYGDSSLPNIVHKTLYPLPYDGTETASPFGGVKLIPTPDCTSTDTHPEVHAVHASIDMEYISPVEGGEGIEALRESRTEAAESNIFRMFWGDLPGFSGIFTEAKKDYRAGLRIMYGTQTYSLLYAYMQLSSRVKTLSSAWTYDDTPKEARIRVQKVKKFIPEDFTSIKSGKTNLALDSGMIETELGPSEQFDPMVRELGDRDEGEYVVDGVYYGDRDPTGGSGGGY